MSPLSASIAAVAAAVVGIQVGNGVLGTYLPMRLDAEGFPLAAAGALAIAHAAGFLGGSLLTGRVVQRFGQARAFQGLAALTAALTATFLITVDPWLWTAVRALIGVCLAGMFIIAESWLNHWSVNATRGRVMAIYQVAQKLAYAVGQGLLAAGGSLSPVFLAVAAASFLIAALPIATIAAPRPPLPRIARLALWTVFRRAPAATVGCFSSGLINNAVIGLAPVYGTRSGIAIEWTAILVALTQVGSLVMQGPIGFASDKMDRRYVILGIGAVGAAMSAIIMAFAPHSIPVLATCFLLWGGSSMSLYAICSAQAFDVVPRQAGVPVSAALQLAWSIGSIVGPAIATLAMTGFGPAGLFGYSCMLSLALCGFIVWRLRARPPGAPARAHFGADHL